MDFIGEQSNAKCDEREREDKRLTHSALRISETCLSVCSQSATIFSNEASYKSMHAYMHTVRQKKQQHATKLLPISCHLISINSKKFFHQHYMNLQLIRTSHILTKNVQSKVKPSVNLHSSKYCRVPVGTTQTKNATTWPWPLTLKFSTVWEVVKVNVRVKLHHAKCFGSWAIVLTEKKVSDRLKTILPSLPWVVRISWLNITAIQFINYHTEIRPKTF